MASGWHRRKPNPTRVYGNSHVKARALAAQHHEPSHPCARCGQPLGPMGPWLHYDHADNRADGYIGFSHRACNVKAGARRGAQVANARRKARRLGVTALRM